MFFILSFAIEIHDAIVELTLQHFQPMLGQKGDEGVEKVGSDERIFKARLLSLDLATTFDMRRFSRKWVANFT